MKPTDRNRIAELRMAKGMRQTALARAMGVGAAQISKIERGQTPLTQKWMYRFAKHLACDTWEILPEWGEKSPAEHIDALWRQTADEEKARLLHKYLDDYNATVGAFPGATFVETKNTPGAGATRMLIEVIGDNLQLVSFSRPPVPDKKG